jgi:hypothetical protein
MRLSSVLEGRNGAMIHPCPSSIKPSGARCSLPDRSMVVTITSRIIGTLQSPRHNTSRCYPVFAVIRNIVSDIFPQRMARFAQAVLVFLRLIAPAAPVEQLILRVALTKRKSDLCLGKLSA